MVTSEREMVRRFDDDAERTETKKDERFTSLQATYEDSVPADSDGDWEFDD